MTPSIDIGDIGPLKGLGVGIAGSYGFEEATQASPDLPTYRSFGQAAIFRYVAGEDLEDHRDRGRQLEPLDAAGLLLLGPVRRDVRVRPVAHRRRPRRDERHHRRRRLAGDRGLGPHGEDNGFRGITPSNPFNPWQGKWGAVEVVARYDSLDIDDDAFTLGFASRNSSVKRATGVGGGINWVWNRNIKIVLDYYHTDFLKGQRGGTGNRPAEDVVIGRVQLAL